jgi:uncharacterized protein (TIGR02099 family)
MSSRPRKLLKGLAIAAAVVVVLCGLLLGAFQVAVSRVPEYRVQLQSWIGERTGLVIEFSRLSARLRLFGPELVFHDAVVRTPDRTIVLASARRGSVGFDLWTSVSTGRLTAGRFSLDSPEIGLIRTREGRIELVGQSALPDRDSKSFAIENLPVGRFRVSDAIVSFRDEATGRGPWALSGVSFNLNRQPHAMELQGNAALPATLGKSLEFSGRAKGALEDSHTVVSAFSIEGDQLDLAGWADLLPDEWPAPETGRGSLLVSGTLRGVQLASLNAKVDFRKVVAVAPVWTVELPTAAPLQIKLDDADSPTAKAATTGASATPTQSAEPPVEKRAAASPGTPELLSYERIAFNVVANRITDGWKLTANDVDVARGKDDWSAGALAAQWTRNAEGAATLTAQADHLLLQNIWPLLAYLPESESLAHLRALQVTGAIDDLSLDMQRASANEPPQYALQANLDDVSLKPVLRAPGLTGLTGAVSATQAGGQLRLDSQNVQFELPRMFRWPLQVQSVQGAIDWQRESAGWRLRGDAVTVNSVDGNVVASFAMTLPDDDSSPVLELKAQAKDLNAASTRKYLPADKMSPKGLEWLDRAFPVGFVRAADVRYAGPTRAFPFRGGEGEFLATAQIEGMTVDYQPGWQPATGMNGQVEFRNQGMRLRTGTAALGGLRLTSISGEFADFKIGDIAVNAVAAGDLGHALKFLQTSPISASLGNSFQKLRGQGESQSRVSLWLPLKRMGDRRILVNTQLKDSTVTMDGVDAPITQLSGTLRVRQSLPDMADLQGQWLGGSLAIAVSSEDKSNRAQVLAKGQANAADLATLLHLPAAVKLNGSTQWQFATQLASGPGTRFAQKFTIDSNLEGLGLELPYPVGKSADEKRPLRLELEYPQDDLLLARSSMGDIRALVRMNRGADGWNLDRGGVRADAIAAALPDHRGFRIEGSLDRLKLDDWFTLRSSSGSPAAAAGGTTGSKRLADYLHAASLRVGTLQLYGYQWADVRGIMQATRSGWQVDVAGPNAAGSLQIPDDFTGNQPLNASLERLIVTSIPKTDGEKNDSKKKAPSDPRSWPALRVFVANFAVDKHTLGTVDLRTSRVPAGIKVDSLTLVQDTLQGMASGQWLMTAEGERSSLNAKVSSTDVGATLRALNYTQFIEAKRGEISADLSWPGGFDGDFLGQASGTLTVNAENGQLLSVQPGAGRVLGLLSVAALPRRLSLDFSDLTDKGLSFDSVHGDFELRKGDAFTSNLLLRGPAAEIGIAGRTGLGAHDYDQTAVVTGNLGATLPVAGALAGGPAVGAALLLFTRVFKEPLKGIARGYYRITGSWDEPVVERVDAAEVREASAAGT